uniref:C2H2-type domain-containing protein n=1 Tax=Oryzias sinensis TaxID=183150 RepID=A0A8C7YYQ9_9TELE
MDHFAAECLVSMSSRAIVHPPKGNREIKPEIPSSSRIGEDMKEPLVKDNSSLFVVARILADFNQQTPNGEQAKIKDENTPNLREDGNSATPTTFPDPLPKQRGKRSRGRTEQESPQKKHKCHYSGCEKVYGKSSHLKAHLRTHTDEDGLERFLHQGRCRIHCPRGFYPDRGHYACLPCISNCELCTDGNICAKCREYYELQNGVCHPPLCDKGQVEDPDTGECIDCESGCETCSSENPEICYSCVQGYVLSRHQCRRHCPWSTFLDRSSGICVSCPAPCEDCRNSTHCLACQPDYFLTGTSIKAQSQLVLMCFSLIL